MGECKHYNQGYCYHFSDNRTKEFCENECEQNCGEEVEEPLEMDCLACDHNTFKIKCPGCTVDWSNLEKE